LEYLGVGQTEPHGGLCLPPQPAKMILTEEAASRKRPGDYTVKRLQFERKHYRGFRIQAPEPGAELVELFLESPRALFPANAHLKRPQLVCFRQSRVGCEGSPLPRVPTLRICTPHMQSYNRNRVEAIPVPAFEQSRCYSSTETGLSSDNANQSASLCTRRIYEAGPSVLYDSIRSFAMFRNNVSDPVLTSNAPPEPIRSIR
jgi:hypothetical protein